MDALDKVVCKQTNCAGRGFIPEDCGQCTLCADVADDVIGTYLRLKAITAENQVKWADFWLSWMHMCAAERKQIAADHG